MPERRLARSWGPLHSFGIMRYRVTRQQPSRATARQFDNAFEIFGATVIRIGHFRRCIHSGKWQEQGEPRRISRRATRPQRAQVRVIHCQYGIERSEIRFRNLTGAVH